MFQCFISKVIHWLAVTPRSFIVAGRLPVGHDPASNIGSLGCKRVDSEMIVRWPLLKPLTFNVVG